MKTLIFTACTLLLSAHALAQYGPVTNDECRVRASTNVEFNKFYPSFDNYNHANVENFGAIGIHANFLKFYFGNFNVSHQFGFNHGFKNYTELVEDIVFEGDYNGGFSATSKRTEWFAMSKIGYQPFRQIEFNAYGGFSTRISKYEGEYFLYPGQVIAEEDLVSSSEAEEANSNIIYKKFNVGLKGALEMSLFPNAEFSPYIKVSYQQYGRRDVYSMSDAALNTTSGNIDIPNVSVANTSDWGVAIGLRLNIKSGCPRPVNTGNSNSNSNSNSSGNSGGWNRNDNNNSGSGGSSSGGGGVVLKPKVRGKR